MDLGLLDQQVLEPVVRDRAIDAVVQRVGRIQVGGHGVPIARVGVHALEERPSEIEPAFIAHVQVLPGAPAHIADVQAAGIAQRGVGAACAGSQRHAIGVPKAHGPHPRSG